MQILVKLFTAGLLAWFGLLAMLIAMRALRGDIINIGFLADKLGAGVAPERALMVAIFPAVVAAYAYSALTGEVPMINGRPSLPEVSPHLLALLTGSNSIYLAGKIARR